MRRFEASEAVRVTLAPAGDGGGFASQVLAPLCQSVAGGLAVGVMAAAVTWAFVDARAWLRVGAVAALVAWAPLYMALLYDARALLRVRVIEPASGAAAAPQKERLIPVIAPGRDPRTLAQNERQARFRAFVIACGRSTARRALREFSEAEIAQFRAVLLRLGYARWRGADMRLGWELTEKPEVILAELGLGGAGCT